MPDSFAGIRLKLSRARDQIETLRTEFERFLREQPYRPVGQLDLRKRIITTRISVAKSADPMWGVKIGEIIHNLRSALDHCIWQLVILETGRNGSTKNQFPIFTDKDKFASIGIQKHLNDVGEKAREGRHIAFI